MTTTTLDCGHSPSPVANNTSRINGIAHTPDGKRVCYDCADTLQRAEVLSDDTHPFMAYLSKGKLTTWTGGDLGLKIIDRTNYRVRQFSYISGYDRTWIKAQDTRGRIWTGRNGGDGLCIRLFRRP